MSIEVMPAEGASGSGSSLVMLSDLRDGQESECFAALVRKQRGTTKKGDPFFKCYFRDRVRIVEAPIWHNARFFPAVEQWKDGQAYRLRVRLTQDPKYGDQIEILEISEASDEDLRAEGYSFFDLVESSDRPPEDHYTRILEYIQKYIDEPPLRELVLKLIRDNAGLIQRMQAAASFHHSYTGGLIEHVWSMTRIAAFLADHYATYYKRLDPPLNKGVVIAATILHDIGKLKELEYNPVEAKYTKEGQLIGHVILGRDMVRDAAREIPGFSEETLLLLEHAILAHHGQKQFGAPVEPSTIEALVVSFIDDLDAKVNMAARHRLDSPADAAFTEKIYGLNNRRFYKGIPLPHADTEADDLPA